MLTEFVRSRFYAKVAVPDENGCTLWQAAVGTKGYGAFALPPRGMVSAHRVAYVLAHGEDIPPGMMLDHLCRIRHCVNPDHLRVVTNRGNLRADGSQHWARTKSEKPSCSRGHLLSDDNLIAYQQGRGRRQCQACMYAHNRLSYRSRKHGISWTEDDLQALADDLYAQRRRRD